jgi:hypothetical protein
VGYLVVQRIYIGNETMLHKVKTRLVDEKDIDLTIEDILGNMIENSYESDFELHHHSVSIYKISSFSVSVTVSAIFV